ncbi:MAG: hypothetical protein QMD53_06700 [Actinomycetota bacterium]|nr:hypothetical protein [Actinomycetota bacterium]
MMGEEAKQQVILECPASYSLSDQAGQVTASGQASIRLAKEDISILPKFGETLFFSLRDILVILEGEYRINLTLSSKEILTLFDLGYKYEDFLRFLFKLRGELLLKDMLMQETCKKSGVEAELVHLEADGSERFKGKGELRLYETAIVFMPEKSEPVRILYGDILEVKSEDYALTVVTEFGERFTFSQMGGEFDPVTRALSDAISELSLKVQSSLRELLPQADPSVIRRVARFMKEGRAAKRSDIETVSADIWLEMERKLETLGLKEEYDFLTSFAQKERMAIGLKRGLLGDLTGEYIWFLIPIYSADPNQPGNAVAMEATGGEGGGKATYFFRIVEKNDYPNYKEIEGLHRKVDDFIKRINRCMLEINFRREPIYLPEEKLLQPEYQKYQFTMQKVPALRELRRLFIGRVIHSSPEQWKNDVMQLLKSNVSREG